VIVPRDDIHRILCIKPRGIGDIVLSTIILDSLMAWYPSATIDFLTERFAVEAVAHLPQVRRALCIEKGESVIGVLRKVRRERYDLVIDLWSNPRSAQVTFFSGARYRAGYAYRGRRYAYNCPGTADRGNHHSAEHNLELLAPLGVPVVSKRLHFHVLPEHRAAAQTWVKENFGDRPIVAIVPSGGWASKRCEPEQWKTILRRFRDWGEPGLLVLWGPGDEPDVEIIRAGQTQNVAVAPPTSVQQLAGFLSCCTLVVANDSGPMHIAAALGVPTIGVFGPTDPLRHGPYGPHGAYVIKEDLHCIRCNLLKCPYGHECMTQLPLDQLFRHVETLAGSRLRTSPRDTAHG
jgi:heptosyltransferase III